MQQQIDTQAMQEFARQNRLFLWASGETDILTDGERLWYCKNGDPLMARITGSGCMSSALLGLLSIENSLESVAACCAFVGLAGELAAEKQLRHRWNDDLSPTIYRHNFAYFITKRNIFKE